MNWIRLLTARSQLFVKVLPNTPLARGNPFIFFDLLKYAFFSADARQKQSNEDIRARVEESMARFGKDRPSREDKGDSPAPRDPEELKRLHEDMINKQKDFTTDRKEVSGLLLNLVVIWLGITITRI